VTDGKDFDSIELMETTQATLDHLIWENPMGETRKDTLRLDFDRKLKLEFHGSKVTSDGGLLAYRELDNALGLTSAVSSELRDIRTGKNTQHGLAALLRQAIYSRLAGYDLLRFFRGDAAFANPEIYRYLEAEGYFYAIRLKENPILHEKVEHMLTRPVGRPPRKPIIRYHSFRYQAASWEIPRRVVAKIEWHAGELFPTVNFIVTNLRWKSSNVVKFYNKRGTAEQWIKKGKYALNWIRLSCHDFADNQVRLLLFALTYNLGNFLRRLALPKSVKKWSLRTLREKLIKIGAKAVSHFRYVIFQMAEVALPRILFQGILERIRQLRFLTIHARPG